MITQEHGTCHTSQLDMNEVAITHTINNTNCNWSITAGSSREQMSINITILAQHTVTDNMSHIAMAHNKKAQ